MTALSSLTFQGRLCPAIIPQDYTHVCVLLHGYGSMGEHMKHFAAVLAPHLPKLAFICPSAPEKCELGTGYQWYSLRNRDYTHIQQLSLQAAEKLTSFVSELGQQLNKPIDRQNLIIGGFSQGAMMSLLGGVWHFAVKAIVSVSGAYLEPRTAGQNPAYVPDNILLLHGDSDDVVLPQSFSLAERALRGLGLNYSSHLLPQLGHFIDNRVTEIIIKFLKVQLQ